MTRTLLWSIVLVGSSVVAMQGPGLAQQPLRVGATMSLTGKQYSLQGGYGRGGYLLCEKHVNERGGLLGRSLQLVVYDDESDEKTAARLYEKLIVEDKVDAVVDLGEGATLADHGARTRRYNRGGRARSGGSPGPAERRHPALVAASVRLDDLVTITRQMRELDFNVKMLSSLPYGLLPDYYKRLGKDAEFVFSATFWEASLPHPGNREFVAAYEREFKRAPAVQSASRDRRLREASRGLPRAENTHGAGRLRGRPARFSDRPEGRDHPVAGRQAGRRLARRDRAGTDAIPGAFMGPAPA